MKENSCRKEKSRRGVVEGRGKEERVKEGERMRERKDEIERAK